MTIDGAERPLSSSQARLWFLHQLAPQAPLYNVAVALRLRGTLRRDLLEQSVAAVRAKHEILRAVFTEDDGAAVQRILAGFELPLRVERCRDASSDEIAHWIGRQASEPFDLATGAMRVGLLELDHDDHALVVTTHHIVSDAQSMEVLIDDVCRSYQTILTGGISPAAAPRVSYSECVSAAERERQDTFVQDLAYWSSRLAGLHDLDFPTDRPRPSALASAGAELRRAFPSTLASRLAAVAKSQNATSFMVLASVFAAWLQTYSGGLDVAFGTPVSGRTSDDMQRVIGPFINTIVLRVDLGDRPDLRTVVERMRASVLEGLTHRQLPFDRVVEALRPPRDLRRNPLVQVLLVHGPKARTRFQLSSGLTAHRLHVPTATANFDLTFSLEESSGLDLTVHYATDLFDQTTIERRLGHFDRLLEDAVDKPDAVLAEVSYDALRERQEDVAASIGAPGDYPRACVHEIFERQARRTPDAIAVVGRDGALSYAELDRRSNALAGRLRELGVGPEKCVGLCISRSASMVVAVLAVMKAGGAYVPLEPDYPSDRLRFMLSDTRSVALITETTALGRLETYGIPSLAIDSYPWAESPTAADGVQLSANNLAYVLYTSGSTGRPKGVAIEHGALACYCAAIARTISIRPGEAFAMVQPLTVDSSITALFPPLLVGGQLHVISRDTSLDALALSSYFANHSIHGLKIAPSHLRALDEAAPAPIRPLLTLVVGGEGSTSTWTHSLQASGPCEVFNHYGPTETTVGVTVLPLRNSTQSDSMTPIGTALPNSRIYVVDGGLRLRPRGAVGELVVGGDQVARGYLARAALTAERFVPDPFGPPGARLYRTGDLARMQSGGVIEFLGRRDDQVKIRGHRVELGEIEATLSRYPGVKDCVVTLRALTASDRDLVAYAVTDGRAAEGDLRRFLRTQLPDFMLPAVVVLLPRLPLTPHGKVDLQALPGPPQPAARFPRAAGTSMEANMIAIWEEVLGRTGIRPTDNFFEVGGHSLAAMRVNARLRDQHHVDLPLQAYFALSSLSDLARLAESREA